MKYSRSKRSNKSLSNFRPRNGTKTNYDNDALQILSDRDYHYTIQAMNKYLELAKSEDAMGNGVEAQGFYQQAEHYSRLINERNEFISASLNNDIVENNSQTTVEDINQVKKKQIKYRKYKNHHIANNPEESNNS